MTTLSIDIETYSPVDLKSSGVYKYAEHPDFEILLFAYAYDDEPVQIVDIASGERLPDSVMEDLQRLDVKKAAFNAAFERICINEFFLHDYTIKPGPDHWECTMVKSAMLGLPMNLDKVAQVLKLDQQKMKAGAALIRYFSMPCKPTAKYGERTRNLPHHDPDKWQLFKEYCKQDVETERAIRDKLCFFDINANERRLWILDQQINDRGVLVDKQMVRQALIMDQTKREQLTSEAMTLTWLDNPNSALQLKKWLSEEIGEEVTSLTKLAVPELLKNTESEVVSRVLEIRQEMSKTSVKKYDAMRAAVCADGRIRGLLQYYGANRTGRWAGRLVQVQNLPQNHLEDLDLARQLVRSGDMEMVEMCYGNVPDTLSQLIRTAFIAGEGKTFIVADFSAIEARVIAWLAGEKWRLDVFANNGDIYCASASQMFRVPVEKHGANGHLRQKGKIAELALGYQGGKGALETMGALRMGIAEKELQPIVDAWRTANPSIVALWTEIGNAAMRAIEHGPCRAAKGIEFRVEKSILWITLPSGRSLCYFHPRIGTNRFGSKSITYEGMDQTTKQWKTIETYGGKIVENIVQAIARDCLASSMVLLNYKGYQIVMHIHDEVVIEMEKDGKEEMKMKDICNLMAEPIPWAKGLPLKADAYITDYYKKD